MTLVELVVSIALIGVVGVAVITAMGAAAMGSGTHRTVASTQAWASTAGERLSGNEAPYRPCGDVSSYVLPDLTELAEQDHVSIAVTAVEFWDGSAWSPSCGGDTAALQRLTVVAEHDRTAQSVKVVKRAPLGTYVHTSVAAGGGGSPAGGGGSFTISPTPGIDGITATTTTTPAGTTTTTTTTPAGTTTTTTTTPAGATTTTTTVSAGSTTTTTTVPASGAGFTCAVTGIEVNGYWMDTVTIQVHNVSGPNVGAAWSVRAVYAGSGSEPNGQFATLWSGTTVTLTPQHTWLTLDPGQSRTLTVLEPGGSMSGVSASSIPCEVAS